MKTEYTKTVHPMAAYLAQAQGKETFSGFDESRLMVGVWMVNVDTAMEALDRDEHELVELVKRVNANDLTLMFVSKHGPESRDWLLHWLKTYLDIDYDYNEWLFTTPKKYSEDGLLELDRTKTHMQLVDGLTALISPYLVGRIGYYSVHG